MCFFLFSRCSYLFNTIQLNNVVHITGTGAIRVKYQSVKLVYSFHLFIVFFFFFSPSDDLFVLFSFKLTTLKLISNKKKRGRKKGSINSRSMKFYSKQKKNIVSISYRFYFFNLPTFKHTVYVIFMKEIWNWFFNIKRRKNESRLNEMEICTMLQARHKYIARMLNVSAIKWYPYAKHSE